MKSMSWLLYEDDYIPHECLSCGFITRSPSIYRRHSRHCADLSVKTGSSSLATIHQNGTDQLHSLGNREVILCDVLASILPAETDCKKERDVTLPCDDSISDVFAVRQKSCGLQYISSSNVDAVKHQDNTITTFLADSKTVTSDRRNDRKCHSASTRPVVELAAKDTMKTDLVENSEKCPDASSQDLNDLNRKSESTIAANADVDSQNEDRDNYPDSNDFDALDCNQRLSSDSTDSTAQKLDAKMKSVGGKMYDCSRCSFKSTSKSERRAHVRTAHSEMRRVHQCKDCSYQSVEHKNLLRHMERHLLTGPFKCNLCTYSSTSLSAVRKHMVFNHCDSAHEQQSATVFDINETCSLNTDESGSKDALSTMHKEASASHGKSINKKSCKNLQSEITADLSAESVANSVDGTLTSSNSVDSEPKLVENVDTSSEACDMIIEVKHIFGSADNISELWTCLSCGMSYEDRAKVRRHVKTKHRISMSACNLVDKRNNTLSSCCNDNSPLKRKKSIIPSEILLVSDDLPSHEQIEETLLKPRKKRKHLSKKYMSTLGGTVEDISNVKMDIREDDRSADVSKKKPQSISPSPVKKYTLNERQSVPKLKIASDTNITTEEKYHKLSSESDLHQQSGLLTMASVPSLKKIKKLVLVKQNAMSLEVSGNQKKKSCTPVKLQSTLVSLSSSDQVSSVSKVLFHLNKRTKVPKLLSLHTQQNVVGVSEITEQIKSDQMQSTPDTPQRSQRPHFSELVKSIKSDDSSSPVKVQKLTLFTAGPLGSEHKSNSGSSELKTDISVQVHQRVGKTKSLHRKKKVTATDKPGTKVEDGPSEYPLDPGKESHEDSVNLGDSSKLSNSSELHPEKDNAADSASSQQLRCAHCSYCSNRLSVLRRHLLSHVSERRYACDRCSRQYKHEWSLTLHQRHAHKKASRSSDEPSLSKDVKVSKTACKNGRSLQKIVKHLKKDRVLENIPKYKKIRIMTNCKPKDEQLEDRNLNVWDGTKDQESSTAKETLGKDMKPAKKFIEGTKLNPHESVASSKCKYCDFVGELASHMKIHTGNRKYRCPVETCLYKSNWACDMKKHIKKYHSDFLQVSGNPSLRDLIHKALDRVSNKALGVRRYKTKKAKMSGLDTISRVDQDSENNLNISMDTLFHRKKFLPTVNVDQDENDESGKDTSRVLHTNARGLNYRKIPAAERYRPYKCSDCGKRSNWRWDIMKHIRLMHLDNRDAHIVVLNAEVARKTLIDMFRRPKSNKLRNTARSTMENEVDMTTETGVHNSVKDNMTLVDVIDSVARGKDLDSRSIGVFDVLRLKRFRCSGCPYRSNHRTDIGRHIRYVHGRGKCKVEVLDTHVASTTLHSYKLSKRRSVTRDLSDVSIADVDHQQRDEIKQSTHNNFTPSEFLANSMTDNNAEVDGKDVARKAAEDTPLSDHVTTKVEDNSWRKRFRDSAIIEYEDMAKCCDICPFRTDRTGLLALHKLRHRAPSTKASKTTQFLYTCPHCPYFVHTSRQLEKHVVLHDGINTTRLDPIVTTTLPVVGNERYVCENCPFVTVYRNDFWIHRRMHLGPGPNGTIPKCELCMFWTTEKRMMLEHIGLHTLCYYPSLVHQANIGCEGAGLNLLSVNQVDTAQMSESVQQLVQHGDEVQPVMESKFNSTSNESRSVFKVLTELCCGESNKNLSIETGDARSSEIVDQPLAETEQNNTRVSVVEIVHNKRCVSNECVDQPVVGTLRQVVEAVQPGYSSPIINRIAETIVDQQNNQTGERLVESRLRGSALIPSCRCALQCPYCYFSIASVRLLRQHIVFHISFCDAKMTPLFDARLDEVEDGVVADDMCGNVKQCTHCWLRSQLVLGVCDRELSPVAAVSMADDNSFFLQMGLRAQINNSNVKENRQTMG